MIKEGRHELLGDMYERMKKELAVAFSAINEADNSD